MKKLYGVGICDSNSKENGKLTKCYMAWRDMLRRCYSSKFQMKWPTYIGCTVHPEWHLFSNFKEFYDANYRDGFQLDKDLLIPGNKVYSKTTCRFVTSCINSLFTDHASSRGEYPIGVSYDNSTGNHKPYQAQISINGKVKKLGRFASIEEASNAYIRAKKEYCILVAHREYEAGNIPLDIRDSIINRF